MTVDHVPRRLRRICLVLALVVVVVFGLVSLLLPRGDDAVEAFGPVDQVAFFVIGLVIAGGVLVLTRFRVRADERGVWVRNSLGERYFPGRSSSACTCPVVPPGRSSSCTTTRPSP